MKIIITILIALVVVFSLGLTSNNLIAYYKMDDAAGQTVVLDSSGNNLTGTAANNITSVNGKVGNAILFTADSNDKIAIDSNSALNFGANTDFTVAVWIKTTNSNRQDITGKDASEAAHWEIFILSNRLGAFIDDGANTVLSTDDGANINDGQWHHVAVTFDRDGLMTRYIDGVAYGTADAISSVGDIDNNGSQYIGTRSAGASDFFDGDMDDLRIYNVALTQSQIAGLIGTGRYDAPGRNHRRSRY